MTNLTSVLESMNLIAHPIDVSGLDFTVTKDRSRYNFNALENDTEDKIGYMFTIEKDENGWFFYAEEHEPEDFTGEEQYFNTLKAAKAEAFDEARHFQLCEWQNKYSND